MKSQGTFEYILLLGGVIIVVLLVINSIVNAGKSAATETNKAVTSGVSKIVQEANNVAQQINA